MNTIYFVQSGEDGPVRVSMCTGSVLARLQAGNPEPLIVRRIYEADRDELRTLHERYGAHHVRGDWFAAAVLDDPPDLREIDFDRDAQDKRMAAADDDARRRGAELALAHLAAQGGR